MKILFLDTEITGLIPKNYNLVNDFQDYPHIVQIAWLVQDELEYKLYEANHLIRPNGYTIPAESTAIHKISTETATKAGVSIKYVLRHLIYDIQSCDLMVGHNLNFDLEIIRANILKLKVDLLSIDKIINSKRKIDTMIASTAYCNIPSPYGDKPKYPKLKELHKKLFNEEMLDTHDAWVDVAFTAKCYYELIKRNVL